MNVRPRKPGEQAQDFAYQVILEHILSCQLAPGQFVSLQELSDELNVSRTPVREAVLRLERDHMMEVFPQSGSMIAYVDFDLADDAIFARRALELAVIEEVCAKATEDDVNKLAMNIGMQELYCEHDMPVELLKADNDFHRMLYAICGRESILASYWNLGAAQFERIRNLRLSSIKDQKTLKEHKLILEAVKKRDTAMARRMIAEHLSGYPDEERKVIMKKYPSYFRPQDD